jgi:hypothetical protein
VRERDIERQLVKRVKALGGETQKLAFIGRRGAPDRLVKMPGKPLMFIELKAPGGRLSRLQDLEHRRLRAIGLDVRVIWKLEDIEGVLT